MISVICPTLNEEEYIEEIIKFFISSEPKEKELLIIDGGSNDQTREIVDKWASNYPNISLFDNANKFVPYALNIGVKKSTGDPIIRLDAHTEYASDYFEKILETFSKTNADIVGGPMRAIGRTAFQKAVAYCTSTRFGIGGSKIHDNVYSGESDHVYLGAWNRKLFDEIGFFDEKLKRNQDDEFHYRARSLGKKIYLNTEIKSYYYPRSSFKKLIKQYFQYGLYKPLVLKKIKSEAKLRHIIPPIFVMYLLTLPIAIKLVFYLIPLIIYLIVGFIYSMINKMSMLEKFTTLMVYFLLHISYGIGFITGIFTIFFKSNK